MSIHDETFDYDKAVKVIQDKNAPKTNVELKTLTKKFFEILDIKEESNMVKNRKLSRCISEQGWREFRTMLEYKAGWYGRELLIVDRFWPTSKTCSCCGRKKNLSLDVRKWTCECGVTHDRDINAAKNILAAGQAVPFACGADERPAKNYVLRGSPRRSRKPS